ncbi:MAG: DNA replication/repair protein RecF, partial [Bacteroidota bacterium]
PIFMLDDVFGDLDLAKTEVLLEALQQHSGQTFITAANPIPFQKYMDFNLPQNQYYEVNLGQIT